MIARVLPLALLLVPISAQEKHKPTALDKQITKLVTQCFHEDATSTDRDRAAAQLAALGIHASRPLVDGYLKTHARFRSQDMMKRTLLAMGAGAEPGITRLIDELLTYQKDTCFKCIELLSEVAPWSPQFTRLMNNVDLDVMQDRMRKQGIDFESEFYDRAWFALDNRTSINPKMSTADLIEYLQLPPIRKPFAVTFAIDLLAYRRTAASAAVPVLAHLHKHPLAALEHLRYSFSTEHECRLATARALCAIAPADPSSLDAMAWLLKRSDQHNQLQAISAIGQIAAPDKSKVTARAGAVLSHHLAKYWQREIPVNQAAVTALGSLGPRAKSAIGILEEMYDTVGWSDELEGTVQLSLEKIR